MVKMKDSGIEWIGEIPEDWEVLRLKFLANDEDYSFVDGDWIDGEYVEDEGIRYLTSGNIGDGRFKRQGNGHISQETFNELKCKYAYPGDLVFSRLNVPYGRSCILPDDEDKYVIAVDNVIFRTDHDKRYLCYVTQSAWYKAAATEKARGTTMKRISRINLGNVPIIVPPLDVQHRIADYLDAKTAIIDEKIAAAKSQIENLKEYRAALIRETVCRGVPGTHDNMGYVNSGVEWIGEVPSGWEPMRIKYLISCFDGQRRPVDAASRNDGPYPYWGAGSITDYVDDYLFDEPLILLGEDGAPFFDKTRNMAHLVNDKFWVNNHIHVLKPNDKMNIAFLTYALNAVDYHEYITGSIILKLTQTKMNEIKVPVPPLAEQEQIASYLDEKTKLIDDTIVNIDQLVMDMEQYRQALIYETVTGKREI